jgi:pimeloyl-ACP methyl ester carboxylesterase
MKFPVIKRGMVPTTLGSIFYLSCDGRDPSAIASRQHPLPPILCFHGSPRSSDEYLEVLPLLSIPGSDNEEGGGRVVIAMDTPGYGASENPTRSCSMDDIADSFLEVADNLLGPGTSFLTMGCLMGAFFCVSMASRYPERVKGGVLTNLYYFPQKATEQAASVENEEDDNVASSSIPDSFILREDGSHLLEVHNKRKTWLDDELNFRVVHSELSYLLNRRRRYALGISIQDVTAYDFMAAAQTIASAKKIPFLCIRGQAFAEFFDMIGYHGTKRFDEACESLGASKGSGDDASTVQVKILNGPNSTLNLINQSPTEYVSLVQEFLCSKCL